MIVDTHPETKQEPLERTTTAQAIYKDGRSAVHGCAEAEESTPGLVDTIRRRLIRISTRLLPEEIDPIRLGQLKLVQNATVGSPDSVGRKITSVYAKSDNYIIYHFDGGRDDDPLTVYMVDKSPDKELIMVNNYTKIQPDLMQINMAMHKVSNPKGVKSRVASAIVMAIVGGQGEENIIKAKEMCKEIKKNIDDEYEEQLKGRIYYLSACFSAVALLSILSIIGFIFRNSDLIQGNTALLHMFYAATFASYGGIISVSRRLKELTFEKQLDSYHYAIFGLSRIFVSVLGGILAFIVIKSQLLFTFIPTSSLYGILFVCLAAGFSEKLVPDILKKFESHEAKKSIEKPDHS